MQRIDKDIPDELREELESKENVVGVAKGPKRTDEGATGEEAIIVFVKQKVPEEELSEDDLVPSTVRLQAEDEEEEEEVQTDVIESGEIYAQAQVPPEAAPPQGSQEAMGEGEMVEAAKTRRDRWRPAAPAGVSVGHVDITAGTLGSPPLLTQDDEKVFLTNAHVAAPPGVERGDTVIQPGKADNGQNPEDQIGTVLEWGQLSSDDINHTDSALVRIDDDLVESDVLGLPDLQGWANARYDELHYKSGRTTGVTNGELIARDFTGEVNYGPEWGGTLTFEGLDVFTAMSAGGDSGSLIGRQKETGFYASDLLFAGSNQITLGIPMNTVQDEHGTLEILTESERMASRGTSGQQGSQLPPQQSMGQRSMEQSRFPAGQTGGGGQRQGSQMGSQLQGSQMGNQMQGQQAGHRMQGQQTRNRMRGQQMQEVAPMGVSGLEDHFSGDLDPKQTEYWYTWGWSDEYMPEYWVVPTNPNAAVEMDMWCSRASDNTLTWHFRIENKSNYHTGFQTKYVVFS